MLGHILPTLRPALVSLALFTGLTGVVYPLVVTGIAKVAFPKQAGGSLVVEEGAVVGSERIGRSWDRPEYFWGRPSATQGASGALPYNGAASGGSNLGPTNPALADAARARLEALRASDPEQTEPVPVDLVTASASGLDPDVSVAAAEWQVHRVAKARGLEEARVRALVGRATTPPQLGIFGEPRVNVQALNRALDDLR